MKRTIGTAATLVLAAALAVVGLSATSSAAPAPTSGSLTPIPLTRVVNTPGDPLSPTHSTVVVTVAGVGAIPDTATAVTGRLVAYDTTAGMSAVEWDGVSGAPGDPTVTSGPTTVAHPSGASSAFVSALNAGKLSVHLLSGAGSFLLEITGYVTPNPALDTRTVQHGVQVAATSDDPNDPQGVTLTHVGGTIVTGATLLSTLPKVAAGHYDVSTLVTDFRKSGTSGDSPADTIPTIVIVAGDSIDADFGNVLATLAGPAIPKMLTATGDIEVGLNLDTNINLPADGSVSVLSFAANTDRSGFGTVGQAGAGDFSSALQSFTLEPTS